MRLLVSAILLAGCAREQPEQVDAAIDGAPGIDAAGDAAPGALVLTSPDLAPGGTFPIEHTCDGANTSPALAWTGDAMGAQSYAVVLTDTTNMLVHWVIYDIPAETTSLPAAVQKTYAPTNVPGAHQTTSFNTAVRGYLGPCPPPNDSAHVYEFAVYALDVAMLPGTSMITTRQQAVPLIEEHQIAKATLTATYDR